MILPTLQQKIIEAMKAHDALRTEVLRMLSSSFNYEKIAKQHELTNEEEIAVVRKQVKQRKDSIEAYKNANSPERAQKEEDEMKILQEFLPPEMSDEEIIKLIDQAIKDMGLPASVSPQAMQAGKVIGLVKSKAPSADGAKIAELVKSKLS